MGAASIQAQIFEYKWLEMDHTLYPVNIVWAYGQDTIHTVNPETSEAENFEVLWGVSYENKFVAQVEGEINSFATIVADENKLIFTDDGGPQFFYSTASVTGMQNYYKKITITENKVYTGTGEYPVDLVCSDPDNTAQVLAYYNGQLIGSVDQSKQMWDGKSKKFLGNAWCKYK